MQRRLQSYIARVDASPSRIRRVRSRSISRSRSRSIHRTLTRTYRRIRSRSHRRNDTFNSEYSHNRQREHFSIERRAIHVSRMDENSSQTQRTQATQVVPEPINTQIDSRNMQTNADGSLVYDYRNQPRDNRANAATSNRQLGTRGRGHYRRDQVRRMADRRHNDTGAQSMSTRAPGQVYIIRFDSVPRAFRLHEVLDALSNHVKSVIGIHRVFDYEFGIPTQVIYIYLTNIIESQSLVDMRTIVLGGMINMIVLVNMTAATIKVEHTQADQVIGAPLSLRIYGVNSKIFEREFIFHLREILRVFEPNEFISGVKFCYETRTRKIVKFAYVNFVNRVELQQFDGKEVKLGENIRLQCNISNNTTVLLAADDVGILALPNLTWSERIRDSNHLCARIGQTITTAAVELQPRRDLEMETSASVSSSLPVMNLDDIPLPPDEPVVSTANVIVESSEILQQCVEMPLKSTIDELNQIIPRMNQITVGRTSMSSAILELSSTASSTASRIRKRRQPVEVIDRAFKKEYAEPASETESSLSLGDNYILSEEGDLTARRQ